MSGESEIVPALWDTYQYIFSCFHDRMLHVVLYYKGEIDVSALKTVVSQAVKDEPILRSAYSPGYFYSSWIPQKEDVDKMVTLDVVSTESARDVCIRSFITREIPATADHQVEFKIVRLQREDSASDTLCILLNHMVADGMDCKYFVETIVEMYNQLVQAGKIETHLKNGSRSVETQFDLMKPEVAEAAKKATSSSFKAERVCLFPFTDDDDAAADCAARIVRVKVPRDVFLAAAAKGKELGATVNDVILAGCFRALRGASSELKEGDTVSIYVDFDLRRLHIPQANGGTTPGLTNFVTTSPVNAKIPHATTAFEETLAQVHSEMAALKRDELCGLYGVWLGATVFHRIPVSVASYIFKMGYCKPSMDVSNLGVFSRDRYTFSGTVLEDVMMSGSVKNKPHFLVAASTFDGVLSLSVSLRGSSRDEALVRDYLEKVRMEIESFSLSK